MVNIITCFPRDMDGGVENMYNAAYKVEKEKALFKIMHGCTRSWVAFLGECSPESQSLRRADLVASATLEVRRLPASVEVVVICAVAAIADGGAVSVLAIDVVIATLG